MPAAAAVSKPYIQKPKTRPCNAYYCVVCDHYFFYSKEFSNCFHINKQQSIAQPIIKCAINEFCINKQ
jgi:hypothetical protein